MWVKRTNSRQALVLHSGFGNMCIIFVITGIHFIQNDSHSVTVSVRVRAFMIRSVMRVRTEQICHCKTLAYLQGDCCLLTNPDPTYLPETLVKRLSL